MKAHEQQRPPTVPTTPSPLLSDRSAEAAEVAEAFTQLITSPGAVSDEAVRDLHRLLAHDLARPNPARLRLGHLRLLIEMVAALDGPDAWVTPAEYMEERARREAAGEDISGYSTESTLREAYGRWVSVVRAASRFASHGGGARVPGNHHHARFRRRFNRQDIMSALIRCRADLGEWPTEWTYYEWAVVKRRFSREDPRLPTAKPIRNCFGDFHEALAATRAAYSGTDVGTDDDD